jgi:hypothetical protein
MVWQFSNDDPPRGLECIVSVNYNMGREYNQSVDSLLFNLSPNRKHAIAADYERG